MLLLLLLWLLVLLLLLLQELCMTLLERCCESIRRLWGWEGGAGEGDDSDKVVSALHICSWAGDRCQVCWGWISDTHQA